MQAGALASAPSLPEVPAPLPLPLPPPPHTPMPPTSLQISGGAGRGAPAQQYSLPGHRVTPTVPQHQFEAARGRGGLGLPTQGSQYLNVMAGMPIPPMALPGFPPVVSSLPPQPSRAGRKRPRSRGGHSRTTNNRVSTRGHRGGGSVASSGARSNAVQPPPPPPVNTTPPAQPTPLSDNPNHSFYNNQIVSHNVVLAPAAVLPPPPPQGGSEETRDESKDPAPAEVQYLQQVGSQISAGAQCA